MNEIVTKLGNTEIPVNIEVLGGLFPEGSEAEQVPLLDPCIVHCCHIPTAEIETCTQVDVPSAPVAPPPGMDVPFALLAALLPEEPPCHGPCPEIRYIKSPPEVTEGLCIAPPTDERYDQIEVGFVMRRAGDEAETDVGETVFADSHIDSGRILTSTAAKGRLTLDLEVDTYCGEDETYPENTILVTPHFAWESITDIPCFDLRLEPVAVAELPEEARQEAAVQIPVKRLRSATGELEDVSLPAKLVYGMAHEDVSTPEQCCAEVQFGAELTFDSEDAIITSECPVILPAPPQVATYQQPVGWRDAPVTHAGTLDLDVTCTGEGCCFTITPSLQLELGAIPDIVLTPGTGYVTTATIPGETPECTTVPSEWGTVEAGAPVTLELTPSVTIDRDPTTGTATFTPEVGATVTGSLPGGFTGTLPVILNAEFASNYTVTLRKCALQFKRGVLQCIGTPVEETITPPTYAFPTVTYVSDLTFNASDCTLDVTERRLRFDTTTCTWIDEEVE